MQQVIELQLAALDLVEKQQSLLLENGSLQDRVRELERQIRLERNLEFDGAVYWRVGEGGKRDGPFCPVCFDDSKKSVRLQNGASYIGKSPWYCLVCKSHFVKGDRK